MPVRYNVDLDVNFGLPTLFSEYYGPYTFNAARQSALARLEEWRKESLAQIQEHCPAEKLEERRQEFSAVYDDHHQTVCNWSRRDVDRKEQDAIAGPLSAVTQVLRRSRRHRVFAEIMTAVRKLDSADLHRLSDLMAKMFVADSARQIDADDEL